METWILEQGWKNKLSIATRSTPILERSAERGRYCACTHVAKRRNDDQLVGKENHIGQRISTCEHTE